MNVFTNLFDSSFSYQTSELPNQNSSHSAAEEFAKNVFGEISKNGADSSQSSLHFEVSFPSTEKQTQETSLFSQEIPLLSTVNSTFSSSSSNVTMFPDVTILPYELLDEWAEPLSPESSIIALDDWLNPRSSGPSISSSLSTISSSTSSSSKLIEETVTKKRKRESKDNSESELGKKNMPVQVKNNGPALWDTSSNMMASFSKEHEAGFKLSSGTQSHSQSKKTDEQLQLLLMIKTDPQNAKAYTRLALTLRAGGCIDVNGQTVTTFQLYLKTLQLYPEYPLAYNNLGRILSAGYCIKVNGRLMTRQKLFREALKRDPHYAMAYYNLATTLSGAERIEVNGRFMDKQQLLLKALESNPRFPQAFVNLTNTLVKGESLKVNGRLMTKQQLLLEALRLHPNYAIAYHNLGVLISKEGSVVVNGVSMTQQQLYCKAKELAGSA